MGTGSLKNNFSGITHLRSYRDLSKSKSLSLLSNLSNGNKMLLKKPLVMIPIPADGQRHQGSFPAWVCVRTPWPPSSWERPSCFPWEPGPQTLQQGALSTRPGWEGLDHSRLRWLNQNQARTVMRSIETLVIKA